MKFTTLAAIRRAKPCYSGWIRLLRGLDALEEFDDAHPMANVPLLFMKILEINGLTDAIWALKALDNKQNFGFILHCAETALKFAKGPQAAAAIQAAKEVLDGNISTLYAIRRARAAKFSTCLFTHKIGDYIEAALCAEHLYIEYTGQPLSGHQSQYSRQMAKLALYEFARLGFRVEGEGHLSVGDIFTAWANS